MKKIQIFLLILLNLTILFNIIGCQELKTYATAKNNNPIYGFSGVDTSRIDPIWNDSEDKSKPADTAAQDTIKTKQIDDWQFDSATSTRDIQYKFTPSTKPTTRSRVGSSRQSKPTAPTSYWKGEISIAEGRSNKLTALDSDLGFSVGGAKDINNFRENIEQGYMPVAEDITHEGIFYDYFFDNNVSKKATHLFEPTYTSLKNDHPLTNQEELYLSVGLNSNLTASSFERKKLNLTIVLDISGSMNSSFDRYYYDGKQRNEYDEDFDKRAKIEIAKECIADLSKHLEAGDRLAIILFNGQSFVAKPFNLIEKTDMDAIRQHIMEINPQGGTNMYAGINSATELYSKLPKYDPKEYDNRIIFLTDAMPNTAVTNENSLWGVMKVNAEKKIYTTFIGVGIDLNNELINYITKTPGANYYSVHNAKEFRKRMDTQFDYMVTPLVFDLTLHLDSDNYDIEAVYGSPEADQATGEIMKVNTLFPSETEDGQTRGGIILIKLKKTGSKSNIKLTCSYKDRNGIPEMITENISFSKSQRGTDNGIRKAVLLSRFVNLMHDWIDNKTVIVDDEGKDDWQYNVQNPKKITQQRGRSRWERNSQKLTVNSYYKEQFSEFLKHFAKEATDIKDPDLRQELDVLEKLIGETKNKEKNKADISIMPDYFFGNWFQNEGRRIWAFGIKKDNFRVGNRFWTYEEINYYKENNTYMIKISDSGDKRTYYFRFESPKIMYYSSDNKNFTTVNKK